jgi:hypothetical protein
MERTPTPIVNVGRLRIASRPMTVAEAAAAFLHAARMADMAKLDAETPSGRGA